MSLSDVGSWASILGVLFTIISAILAVLIYKRQGSEQRNSTAGLHSRFNEQDELLKEVARRAKSDLEPEPAKQEDLVKEDARAQENADVYLLDGVSVYPPQDIPLRVLGDLVQGWRKQGHFTENGGWLLGEIVQGLHKQGAKGNHPWRVVLIDRDKPKRRFVWKISRGGQGKTEPTVTDETGSYDASGR